MKALLVVLAVTSTLTAAPTAANHDTLCDRLSLAPTCDTPAELEARYVCWAVPAMSASKMEDQAPTDDLWWEVQSWGFHGCPDSSGDIVRVIGTLNWTFDGQGGFLPPRTCMGYGDCTNDSDVYQLVAGPVGFGVVTVSTTSPNRGDGAVFDAAEYVFT